MLMLPRGGASIEKVGWTRGKIDCQKVYPMFFTSFLLRNIYQPEESGVDMSTPVHPMAPPFNCYLTYQIKKYFIKCKKN